MRVFAAVETLLALQPSRVQKVREGGREGQLDIRGLKMTSKTNWPAVDGPLVLPTASFVGLSDLLQKVDAQPVLSTEEIYHVS